MDLSLNKSKPFTEYASAEEVPYTPENALAEGVAMVKHLKSKVKKKYEAVSTSWIAYNQASSSVPCQRVQAALTLRVQRSKLSAIDRMIRRVVAEMSYLQAASST